MKYQKYYNYRVAIGFSAFIRDLVIFTRNFLISLFYKNHKKILFYPQFPDWKADIFQALYWSKYQITSNPNEEFDHVVFWEDTTFRSVDSILEEISHRYPVVNLQCLDISKQKVESAFLSVFGYNTFVDPFTYNGVIVEKSNYNSKHCLARKLLAPIVETKPEFIYQKMLFQLIDDSYIDYRVPFVKDQIPIVLIRYRAADDIFDSVRDYKSASAREVFSEQEISSIQQFCKEMCLEYGEMDIIRNNEDSRLYIIDVNNTPHEPRGSCNTHIRNQKNKIIKKLFIEQLNEIKIQSPVYQLH